MSLTEKAAYLRGLYDGMEMNEVDSKEAKLLGALVEMVQDLAAHVSENEASLSALADEVDDLSEITAELEEIIDDEFDDDDLCFDEDEDSDEEDEDDYDEEDDGEFETHFEVECPNCAYLLTVGEEELSTGVIECPTCGQKFQIELEFDDDGELIEDPED